MHFYALRIVCRQCGAALLLGGCAQNDLTRYRGRAVECRYCGAQTQAATGEPVDLSAPSDAAEAIEDIAGELVHA